MAQLFLVDSFTERPFSGNPAGVCLLDAEASEPWMLNLAAEVNVSETAFVIEQKGKFQIRWFTPIVEVPLCGHATLASAHVLWESGLVDKGKTIVFDSQSGALSVKLSGTFMEMDFPSSDVLPADPPKGLLESLGLSDAPLHSGWKSDLDVAVLELASESMVTDLSPDFSKLKQVEIMAAIVTSRALEGKKYDFVSRFFAPKRGINEDPVTSSAHCALGPYWAKKLNKKELIGFQASSRGGMVTVRPEGNRVILGGRAVTVYDAKLRDAVLDGSF